MAQLGNGRQAEGGRFFSYENKLLATLSVAESSMFVDRLALGILTPFLVTDLDLSKFEIGLLASAFSLSYAVSGYVGGWISDRTGQRRTSLLLHVLAFSIISAITGLTWNFVTLLIARIVLGLAEGAVLPLLQSIMIPASSPHRKAFNAAFLMNVAPFIVGQFAAPIVLTQLADQFDWRLTFAMTAIPGLLILPFLIRLVPRNAGMTFQEKQVAAASGESLFRNRNMLICVAMAACTGTWIYMINTFLPFFLVDDAGYSKTQMGFLVSAVGIGGCVASLILPALSDRIGRGPVLIGGFVLGLILPISVLLFSSQAAILTAGILVGSCLLGVTPLTITLIPSDSVAEGDLARAIGLTSASSAIIGGMIMTVMAGKLADIFGLQAPLLLAVSAMCLAIVLALFLKERPSPAPAEADA